MTITALTHGLVWTTPGEGLRYKADTLTRTELLEARVLEAGATVHYLGPVQTAADIYAGRMAALADAGAA